MAAVLAFWPASACRSRARPDRALRLVFAARPQSLDPQRHRDDVTRAVLAHFYEPLIARGPGLDLRPGLALEWSSAGARTWRVVLRPGVAFHDGSPFGAPDVKRTIERARTLGDPDLRAIVEVRTPDEHTVELVTDRPRPLLPIVLARTAILPRNAGPDEIRQPNGTGPYRFDPGLSRPDRDLVAGVRFDRYWGDAPAFPSFRLEAVPEDPKRLAAAKDGADLVSPLPAEALDAKGRPLGSYRAVRRPTLSVSFLACRLGRLAGGAPSPFRDARVRRAVELALDRDAIVRGREREMVPADQLVVRGVAGYLLDRPRAATDRAAARRLLREAGFASGFESTLVAPMRARGPALEVARQLAAVGLQVRVESLPRDEMYPRMVTGQAPLSLVSWTAETGDAASVLEACLHSRRGPLGAENTTGYASAALDAAVDRAALELRPSVRAGLLHDALRLALDERPLVPLYTPLWTDGVGSGVDLTPRLDRMAGAMDLGPATR